MRLDTDPEISQMTGQVRVEGAEGEPREELMHGWTAQLVDGERN